MPALPEEILSRIVKFINFDLECKAHREHAENESVSTLRSLCLVSKTFRRLGYYVLYHHFQPRLDSHYCDQATILFLRTLVENASVSALVKKVSLGPIILRRPDTLSPRRLMPNSDGNFEQRSCTTLLLSLCDKTTSLDDVWLRSTDVCITFLLSFCAKITSLDLRLGAECGLEGSYFIEVLDQHWNKQSPSYMGSIAHDKRMLSSLQSLKIGFEYDENYESMTSITPFLYLPSLIELEASELTTCCPRGLSESASFNLIHLHLKSVTWTVSDLSELLRACPRLETLDLIAEDSITSIASSELDFPALGDVLRQHGTLLKNVTIDPRKAGFYYDAFWESDYYDNGLLGSLQPLTKLRALKVPVSHLLHISWIRDGWGVVMPSGDGLSNIVSLEDELRRCILPESIKQLTLLDCLYSCGEKCVFYIGLHELLIHLCRGDDKLSCDTFTADTRMIQPQSFLSLPSKYGSTLSCLCVPKSHVFYD